MRAREFIREAEDVDLLRQQLEKERMPQHYIPPDEYRGKNISLPRDQQGRPIEPGLEQPLVSPEDVLLPFAGSLGRKLSQVGPGLIKGAVTKSTPGVAVTSVAPQATADLAQKAELAAKYPWQQRTKWANLPPEGPFSKQTYQTAMKQAREQTPPPTTIEKVKDIFTAPKIGDYPNPLATRNIGKGELSAEKLAQRDFEKLYGRPGSARDLADAVKLDALRDQYARRGYQSFQPTPKVGEFVTNIRPGGPFKDQLPWTPEKLKRELKKQADIVGDKTIPALGVDAARLAADYAKNWSATDKDKKQK